jgi:hypothetical protein
MSQFHFSDPHQTQQFMAQHNEKSVDLATWERAQGEIQTTNDDGEPSLFDSSPARPSVAAALHRRQGAPSVAEVAELSEANSAASSPMDFRISEGSGSEVELDDAAGGGLDILGGVAEAAMRAPPIDVTAELMEVGPRSRPTLVPGPLSFVPAPGKRKLLEGQPMDTPRSEHAPVPPKGWLWMGQSRVVIMADAAEAGPNALIQLVPDANALTAAAAAAAASTNGAATHEAPATGATAADDPSTTMAKARELLPPGRLSGAAASSSALPTATAPPPQVPAQPVPAPDQEAPPMPKPPTPMPPEPQRAHPKAAGAGGLRIDRGSRSRSNVTIAPPTATSTATPTVDDSATDTGKITLDSMDPPTSVDVARINCSVHIERNITQSKDLFEDQDNVSRTNGLVESLKEHAPLCAHTTDTNTAVTALHPCPLHCARRCCAECQTPPRSVHSRRNGGASGCRLY